MTHLLYFCFLFIDCDIFIFAHMIYSYDLCIYAGSIYEKMNLYHVSLKARGGNEGSLIMFYFLHVKVLLIVIPKNAHLPHNSQRF